LNGMGMFIAATWPGPAPIMPIWSCVWKYTFEGRPASARQVSPPRWGQPGHTQSARGWWCAAVPTTASGQEEGWRGSPGSVCSQTETCGRGHGRGQGLGTCEEAKSSPGHRSSLVWVDMDRPSTPLGNQAQLPHQNLRTPGATGGGGEPMGTEVTAARGQQCRSLRGTQDHQLSPHREAVRQAVLT
jgi:hypothetical protein